MPREYPNVPFSASTTGRFYHKAHLQKAIVDVLRAGGTNLTCHWVVQCNEIYRLTLVLGGLHLESCIIWRVVCSPGVKTYAFSE